MNDDLTQLRATALALLGEREATTELTIEHVATNRSPLSKGRVLRLRVVRGDEPNGPHWAIALDESGEEVDIERLPKREQARLFRRDLKVDRNQLRALLSAQATVTISPTENDLVLNPDDALGPDRSPPRDQHPAQARPSFPRRGSVPRCPPRARTARSGNRFPAAKLASWGEAGPASPQVPSAGDDDTGGCGDHACGGRQSSRPGDPPGRPVGRDPREDDDDRGR
jgi:hypothetical protein